MNPKPSAYGLLMLAGIGVSVVLWRRRAKRDDRLLMVFIGGLCGAFIGAKLVYLASEGWLHFGAEDFWLNAATGKTIVGALLWWVVFGFVSFTLCFFSCLFAFSQ
jgi:prolipoprotein diacylglyceryltransferase